MSDAVDLQHLFQLDQVLSVDDGTDESKAQTIVSHDVSHCGRAICFIAGSESSGNGSSKGASVGSLYICGTESSVFWVPWYEDGDLRPSSVTFSAENDFCLVGCINGALFILPSKVVCPRLEVRRFDANAKEWSRRKVTAVNMNNSSKRVFASLDSVEVGAGELNIPSTRCTHPTSLLWWTTQDLHSLAVVGTKSGWVVIVDLISGKEIGFVRPTRKSIVQMEEITDNALDCTYLFITDREHKQWRVLLERRSTGFSWCGANDLASSPKSQSKSPRLHRTGDNSENHPVTDKSSHHSSTEDLAATPRSRLANIKSMSVASFASLRQKISEGRKMLDKRIYSTTDACPSDQGENYGQMNSSLNMGEFLPESLNSRVGDTRLSVQRAFKGHHQQFVLGGLFPDTAILTIHNSDLEVLPQVAFRLPRQTENVLVLDKLMVTSGTNKKDDHVFIGDTVRIVSAHYAEIHIDTSKCKEEPVIQTFILSEREVVRGIYKGQTPPQVLAQGSGEGPGGSNDDTESSSSSETTSSGEMPDPEGLFVAKTSLKVDSTKRKSQRLFQDCFLVTSKAIYVVRLDKDPVTTFLESSMQGDVRSAEKVAATFDLDAKALLELAADIRLSEKDFAGAIALYRLSGCKHLKAVLKFAASGHVQELLSYLSVLFKTPNLDVTVADKMKLSNLTLMAYFHQVLLGTAGDSLKREEFRQKIAMFLSENFLIDETLAIKLALETREWVLLCHFCAIRGLFKPMMRGICSLFTMARELHEQDDSFCGKTQTLQELSAQMVSDMSPSERRGLTACLAYQENLVSLVDETECGQSAIKVINGMLPFFTPEQFQAISRATDPGQPGFCPLFKFLLYTKVPNEEDLARDLLEFHLNIAITLYKKLSEDNVLFEPDLVKVLKIGSSYSLDVADLKVRPGSVPILSAGPGHAIFVKAGKVFSWGTAQNGVLGHSPLARCAPPREVEFFQSLRSGDEETERRKINVFGVGCGKSHSLALTDCGLYSWGSSKYGQLGHGPPRLFSKQPEIIKTLANEIITSFSCGHYHNVALDAKNRVWTWGWGVHGQLGLDDIEDEHYPRRIRHKEMNKEAVCRVSAGYAHTMVSTYMGNVWVFGCAMFGQLGSGTNKKSSVPLKVDLNAAINGTVKDERIDLIAAGHFHNLAVSHDGTRLYTWGCNPHMLRLEAQQRKKDRLIQAVRKEEDKPEAEKRDKDLDEEKEHEMLHLIPFLLDTSFVDGKIVSVSAGNQHSMILTELGKVYTFGRNTDGQLGVGSRKDSKLPGLVSNLKDDVLIQISCCGDYSLAINERGNLFAWGNNSNGQLGKPPLESEESKALGRGGEITTTVGGKVMVIKNTKKVILQHSLQNSCDVPKPVQGLTQGEIYSDNHWDPEKLHQDSLENLGSLVQTVNTFRHLRKRLPEETRHKHHLHRVLETFHKFIDHKKIIKRCLMLDNLQAAAKCSLLSGSKDGIFQSFEFTLQSVIKQSNCREDPAKVSEQIFKAYNFYLHFETGDQSSKIKLTERLIACWQDLKFSFSQLEQLFSEQLKEALLVQVLVLTLFCPEDERALDETGPGLDKEKLRMVDFFTPEFCLKVGDIFVSSFKEDAKGPKLASVNNFDVDGNSEQRRKMMVSQWLQRQRPTADDDEISKNLSQLVQKLMAADCGSA